MKLNLTIVVAVTKYLIVQNFNINMWISDRCQTLCVVKTNANT